MRPLSKLRSSGQVLMIFALALFIISGLLIAAGPEPTNSAFTTEPDESQLSSDAEVISYNNLSAAGQDLFDRTLRTNGVVATHQSPPDFEYPGDTADTTYVEKNGTIYAITTTSNTCRTCTLADALSIVAGLAGIILLVLGVSRRRNGDADATED